MDWTAVEFDEVVRNGWSFDEDVDMEFRSRDER
jgi:hypothetical protein